MKLLITVCVSLALGACAHPCEDQNADIPGILRDAGLIMENPKACDFGSPRESQGLENLGFAKLYHGSGEYWRSAEKYIRHLQGSGWQRVACTGGLGETVSSDIEVTECFMKRDQIARIHAYDFNGAIVDVDLLELVNR